MIPSECCANIQLLVTFIELQSSFIVSRRRICPTLKGLLMCLLSGLLMSPELCILPMVCGRLSVCRLISKQASCVIVAAWVPCSVSFLNVYLPFHRCATGLRDFFCFPLFTLDFQLLKLNLLDPLTHECCSLKGNVQLYHHVV